MNKFQFNDLRDDIFKLTGIAVAQFQFLEQVLTASMAFVWPKKSEQMMAEITASNPIRRGETIGRMLAVLRKTISAPADLDQRLSVFLENSNRLIHHSFREYARTGEVPTEDELKKTKREISDLIKEAEQLRRIFFGFFSVMGKQLASREGLTLESDLFTFLAPYQQDFDSAFVSAPSYGVDDSLDESAGKEE
jgi:hypothetical protein